MITWFTSLKCKICLRLSELVHLTSDNLKASIALGRLPDLPELISELRQKANLSEGFVRGNFLLILSLVEKNSRSNCVYVI